jgi:hypothetical protein
MANFTAIYDSCVLYPAPLRDLLMWLALSDLFRARWSNDIHEEWIRNLLEDRPDLTRERLERTRDKMNSAIFAHPLEKVKVTGAHLIAFRRVPREGNILKI